MKYFCTQVLYGTPDQKTFYDITDALEEEGMEAIVQVSFDTDRVIPDLRFTQIDIKSC